MDDYLISSDFLRRQYFEFNREILGFSPSPKYINIIFFGVHESERSCVSLGKVRTSAVKRLAREILEVHPGLFTPSFEKNKEILQDNKIAKIPTKRLRNRILGYITHLVKLKVIDEELSVPASEADLDELGEGVVPKEP
jgi:small subunit ribosomal protein S17e